MKHTQEELIRLVEQEKLIVILRGLNAEQLTRTVAAMVAGGIRLVEVTFDQSGKIPNETTAEHIRMLVQQFGDTVQVGAGTVMTAQQVELAHKAGAGFIISPDTFRDVIERTKQLGMLSMPGAFTPTEAAMAHRWGADFVKLFPNAELGLNYLKAIAVPLSNIRFLAVGGVTESNLADYLNAGACGAGIATGIVDKQAIAAGNYEKITRLAAAYTTVVKNCK